MPDSDKEDALSYILETPEQASNLPSETAPSKFRAWLNVLEEGLLIMSHLHIFENVNNVSSPDVPKSLFFPKIFDVIKISDVSATKLWNVSEIPGRPTQEGLCRLLLSWLKTVQSMPALCSSWTLTWIYRVLKWCHFNLEKRFLEVA